MLHQREQFSWMFYLGLQNLFVKKMDKPHLGQSVEGLVVPYSHFVLFNKKIPTGFFIRMCTEK